MTLVFWRVSLASVFLFVLFGQRAARLKKIWQLRYWMLYLGFFGCATPFAFYAYGQQYVNSSFAGIANATMPLFTYLLAVLVGQDQYRKVRMLGIVIGICGVATLFLANNESASENWFLGGLLCVCAPVCYAISTVSVRRISLNSDYLTIATGMIVGATILSLGAMLAVDGLPTVDVKPKAMFGAVGMALFGTALAYRIFMYLIDKVGSFNASLAVMLVPFVAVVLGIVFLNEQLDRYFAAATGLIIVSLICIDEQLRTWFKKIILRLA